MARLWSSGFELGTTAAAVEWTAFQNTPTISSSVVRTGNYSLQIIGFSSGSPERLRYQFTSSSSQGPIYARAYLMYETLPTAANAIVAYYNSGGVPRIMVKLDESGQLTLHDEDGQIGSPSSVLSKGVWYRIELMYDVTAAGGSHVVRGRLNGVEFAGAADRDLADTSGFTSFVVGGNINSEAQTVGNWFFDDIAINDSNGSFQNSYPGEGRILHVIPNATGDNGDWTGDNTDIDEVTPDDNTTKISSNTATQVEDVDLSTALTSSDTITLVQVGARFNGVGASANASFVLRVKASGGGTTDESSAITPSNATWRTNTSADPANYSLTLYDLPGGSTTAWSKSDLDTAQIGVRLSASSTNAAQISTLWLLVEYVSGSTGSLNHVQGVLGEYKPVADRALGPLTANHVQGVFGQFVPVIDDDQALPASSARRTSYLTLLGVG